MLNMGSRSQLRSVKKKGSGTSILQDMNFLCLKEFYNSIPDYSDINHLPEKEFYKELNNLKKKQHELTHCRKSKCSSRSSNHHDFPDHRVKRNLCEKISYIDNGNSGNSNGSWQLEIGSTSQKHENRIGSRLSSAASRPRTSAESRSRKIQLSKLSNVQDDYNLLTSLKNFRSKSISPVRSQVDDLKYQKVQEEENKFYSDITNDKLKSVDHTVKRDPIKDIPITSRIPLYNKIMEDQAQRNQIAKLNSAIRLTSKIKPFHFHESRHSASVKRCLSRSYSSPHLKYSDESDFDEGSSNNLSPFKARPFPRGLFCNAAHYKMWEDNYFRALNKKLRAEELLKISKLPPSMKKREDEKKDKDILIGLDVRDAAQQVLIKTNVEFESSFKKRRLRKKLRRSKSAYGSSRSQHSKLYIFDSKRDKDKASIKSDATTTTTATRRETTNENKSSCLTPAPIYPVNRPNLAATLRYEWSREKIKKIKDTRDLMMRDSFRKPSWGVKTSHAFQQLHLETSNHEEIAIRLATRKAEQKLRQEEHELNMEMMKQRVKTSPLLLEGPTQLAPRLGHIYHHCDAAEDKKKVNSMHQLNVPHSKSHHNKGNRPGSSISTDSKLTEESSIN